MIFLAVTAAVMWGVGNFAMGIAVRESSPRATVLVGFGTGLLAALIFSAIQRPIIQLADFAWGILAGLAQGIGWLAFSRALKATSIGAAAPIAATTTTAVLFIGGLATGSGLTALAALGIAIALIAIVLLSDRTAARPATSSSALPGYGMALSAGLLFSLQSVALDRAGVDASSLVLIGTGFGVLMVLAATVTVRRIPLIQFQRAAVGSSIGGLLIFGGDAGYLYALARGVPVSATVIAQLHPLVTALLAGFLLRERVSHRQLAGMALALSAVTIIGMSH